MYAKKQMLTRREACVLFGALGAGVLGAGATLGLAACGADDDPTSRQGFASDTEVKSYPVHLKIYVDSYLQWHLQPGREPQTHLERHIERYREQKDRAEVSFEVAYADPAEMLALAREGFPDGDGLLAVADTVYEGCASGVVDSGVAYLYVRDLGYHYRSSLCFVRAQGSDADLPPAATLSGKETREFTQLQQLPHFEGMIALADPETTLEGRLANNALASEDFYLDYTHSPMGGLVSGNYAESIAEKIAHYPSQDAAMAALAAGECQLGFALQASLSTRYPEVEVLKDAPGSAFYSGAALLRSPEPGVMRDFFQFETSCSD